MTELKITTCPTFTATIYIGMKKNEYLQGMYYSADLGRKFCQEYCDEVGLCVTVTETKFIYSHGNEPGLIVGLINYPRFPKENYEIRNTAIKLAELLKLEYKQDRCSIVFPDETIMLGE